MTIKRKTQLNLSGSHHTLDSDNAFIGGTVYVTGSVSASVGKFQYLTGSLSGTLGGLPFIVAGPNITASYNDSTGQWAITGSSGGSATPAGVDRTVQFNNNGAFAGDVDLQFYSNSLGNIGANTLAFSTGSVSVLSGALTPSGTVFGAIGYSDNILEINTSVLVTQSMMIFDGAYSEQFNGIALSNGAGLIMSSGSLTQEPPFSISPAGTADSLDVSVKGFVIVKSGSLAVNSGSASDSSFTVEPSTTAGQVNVIFDRIGSTGGVNFAGINVRPLYSTMTTVGATGYQMSGSLLSAGSAGANSIGKIDFNIIAVQKDTDNYGSWTFSTTVARDSANVLAVVAYSELDATTSGSDAAAWDVNINSDAVIYCTGSAGSGIQWYAHVTKKMFLSGSGLITY